MVWWVFPLFLVFSVHLSPNKINQFSLLQRFVLFFFEKSKVRSLQAIKGKMPKKECFWFQRLFSVLKTLLQLMHALRFYFLPFRSVYKWSERFTFSFSSSLRQGEQRQTQVILGFLYLYVVFFFFFILCFPFFSLLPVFHRRLFYKHASLLFFHLSILPFQSLFKTLRNPPPKVTQIP